MMSLKPLEVTFDSYNMTHILVILGGYEIIFMNIQEEYEKELKLELKLIWRNTKKKKKQNVSQHLQAV